MAASLRSLPRKWLLSFNDPRWAFLQAAAYYFIVCSIGGSPFRLSVAPYFQFLADAFLHGQLHLRLLPPTVHDLVSYGGQYYLYWPPFPAVALMPLVALFGVDFSDVFITLFVGAFNVSLLALLLKAANQRGLIPLDAAKRAWLVIFFAFGTVHLNLAANGNVWSLSQVLSTSALLVAYCAAVGLKGWRAYLVAGLGMAAAMATRYPLILAGVWPAWQLIRSTRAAEPKKLLRNMLIGSVPILVTGALIGLYNFTRFGSPFDYGYAYHNMSEFFRPDYETYGPFNLHYVPINIYYQYLYYPFPVREDFLMGGSLFLLSPVFFAALYSLWKDRRSASTWMLFLTMTLVNIPILLLMGTGWQQFGPRYTLDFTVPLLLLTAQGCRNWPKWLIQVLIVISVLHYLVGALIYILGTTL